MRTSVPTSSRAPGWTLVGLQFGYAVLYLVGGYLALAHAAGLAGKWFVPEQGDAFTESLAGWGPGLLIGLLLSVAPMVAALGLLSSVMLFILGYTRGNRRLTGALIAGTVVTLGILVVSLTPAAQSVSGWLLD